MTDQLPSQLSDVLDARLVVVTGKGGTGRTTVAAALGLAAAARGRRAIVCEVAGQQRVPALLGQPGGTPAAVEHPVADGLWATTIDPNAALVEWLGAQVPRRLAGLLARSGAFSAFVGAAPGARELVTITKAWELGERRRWSPGAGPYDTVILDAPASGHGLGLLRTPRTFADIARIGPIATQARAVDEALTDPARSAIVAVTLPGELAVSETLELDGWLRARLGRGLDAIVANGVWPRRLSRAEAARVAAATGVVLPEAAGRAAAAAAGRAGGQRRQLERLRRAASAPVRQLPFLFAPRLGAPDVSALAEHLARP
ncbi:MAG TPA: ArsA-related P-loop ATPase [Baekduia sp.]|nr:ArsA-related P-loop ATPase [Baekduia sp.]